MNVDDCVYNSPVDGNPTGINISNCADFIIETLKIITPVPCRRYETMLYYNDGMYISDAAPLIRRTLETHFGRLKNHNGRELLNTHIKDEVMDKIASRTYREMYSQISPVRVPTFDSDKDIINTCNGLYNWRTGEFKAHTYKYLSRCQASVEYHDNANCPTLLEIIKDVLQPKDVDKYIEFLAYSFYRAYPIQKAMIFFGPAGSGKSQLLAIPRNLIGNENTTCVTFQMLGGTIPDPYATAKLYNKLLNIAGDLDNTKVNEVGKFKMLTSDEDLTPARFIYGAPFEFLNYAKTLMSANELPPVNDRSDGFYRRIDILEFKNSFTSDGDKFDRLFALSDPMELSGLFNLCMEKLPELLERRQFTNALTIEEAKTLYRKSSNTIETFINEYVEDYEGGFIPKKELYKRYCHYCKSHGLAKCPTDVSFGLDLAKTGFKPKEGFRRIDGKNPKCWIDVRFK